MIILGLVKEKQGKNDEALEYLKNASKIPAYALESCYRMGKIYEKLKNSKAAIHQYKNCLQIKRTHLESLTALGSLLLQEEEYDRAMKYYRHAIKITEENVEILYGYSLAVFKSYCEMLEDIDVDKEELKLRRYELTLAIKSLKKIKELNPEYQAAFRLLGEIYLKEKKIDLALEHLKTA